MRPRRVTTTTLDQWEQLVANGADPGDAARQLGYGGSTTFRTANPERHAHVIDLWHSLQAVEDRRTARDTLHRIAVDKTAEARDQVRAAELLGKAAGYLTDRAAVEVTGAAGGPMEVEIAAREARDQLAARLAALTERRAASPGDQQPQ